MVKNKRITTNKYSSTNNEVSDAPMTRVGKVFVVEAIENDQVRLKFKEHIQQLLTPILKPLSYLFFWNVGYLFIIFLACVLWTIPVSIIPMRNAIADPFYWWEILVKGAVFGNSLLVTGNTFIEIKTIFEDILRTVLIHDSRYEK